MAKLYEKLHALAAAHKPDLPIKTTSTWIAVLLHTIDDLEDITTDKDFLWIKCHSRITMKTIKYNYWSRYPVEELKLKYNDMFPKPRGTVSELAKRQKKELPTLDKKHANIIVLRALEPEGEDACAQLAQDHALTDEIRMAIERDGHGTPRVKTKEDAIVLSDSEDEDQHKHNDSGVDVDMTGDDGDGEVVEYRGLGAYTSASLNVQEDPKAQQVDSPLQSHDANHEELVHEDVSPVEDSIEANPAVDAVSQEDDPTAELSDSVTHTDHTPEDYQLLIDAGQLDPASYQLMVESGQVTNDTKSAEQAQELIDNDVSSQIVAQTTNHDNATQVQTQTQFQPTFVPYRALHPGLHANINVSKWYNCASPFCQRQMVVKPWTRYHYSTGAPLCTQCTRVLLSEPSLTQDIQALSTLESQVQQELAEKEGRQSAYIAQNPAEDAPFDWFGVLRGPMMPTQWSQQTSSTSTPEAPAHMHVQVPTTGYGAGAIPATYHAQPVTAAEGPATITPPLKLPTSQASSPPSLQSPVHTTQAHGAFVNAIAQPGPQPTTVTSNTNNVLLPAFNGHTVGLTQAAAEDNYDITGLIDDDSPFLDASALRARASTAAYGPVNNAGAVTDGLQGITAATHGGSYDFDEQEEEGEGTQLQEEQDEQEEPDSEEDEEDFDANGDAQFEEAVNKPVARKSAAKDDDEYSDGEYVDDDDSDY